MTANPFVRSAAVIGAVLAAQWLSAAALAPVEGGTTAIGAGPWLSVPWLVAGVVVGLLAWRASSAVLWPWLVMAAPLVAPESPASWLFTGPGVVVAWTLVAVAATWAGAWPSGDRLMRGSWSRSAWSPALAATLWLGTTATLVAPHALSGDAPHYLTITQSLVEDGDLDLTNNYDERTHRSFFAGALEPRHTVTSPWGPEYPFHGLGVSVLVAPGFAGLGARGATGTLVLVMAAGAALLWTVVRDLTGKTAAAWFGWACLVASAPYSFHAAAIYPDGPAAVAVIGGLWLLARDRSRPPASLAALAAVGAALTALPWLHARLALPAGVLGLACVVEVLAHPHDRWTRVSWLLMLPIIGCAAWVAAAYVMFDTWNPAATILRRTAPGALSAAPRGIIGMLVDREFGLLPTSPIFALTPVALVALWHRRRLIAVAGATALAGVMLTSSLWVWWGGDSAPARFLTVVLPVAAAGLGVLWATSGPGWRRLLLLALVLTVMWTALMATVDGGAHVFNFPDGRGSLFDALSPAVSVALALPSMLAADAAWSMEVYVAAIWLGAATLAAMLVVWWPAERRGGLGVAALAVLVISGAAASAAWAARGVTATTPATAHLHLATRLADTTAPSFWPPGGSDPVIRALTLRTPESLTLPPEAQLYVPNVPAGAYVIERTRTASPDIGSCRLELGRDTVPYATWMAPDTPPALTLATAVHSVRVGDCGGSVADMWLRPLASPRPSGAVARRVIRLAPLDVYALDDSSYVDGDGFWTGADRVVSFLIASPVPATVIARVAAGPATVALDIRHGQSSATLEVGPDASRRVELGAVAGDRPLPVRIDVKGGFPGRLLDVRDSRSLGVRLSFEAASSAAGQR